MRKYKKSKKRCLDKRSPPEIFSACERMLLEAIRKGEIQYETKRLIELYKNKGEKIDE